MKVSFVRSFLSIGSFPDCALPQFTVITGKNGAGKSHFLQSLKQGHLATDIAKNPEADIHLVDWNSLVPQATQTVSGHGDIEMRTNMFERFKLQRQNAASEFRKVALTLGLPDEYSSDLSRLTSMILTEFVEILRDEAAAQQAHSRVSEALESAWSHAVASSMRDGLFKSFANEIRNKKREHLFSIDIDSFFDALPPQWGTVPVFQQSFGQLFITYRNLKLENELRSLRKAKGEPGLPPLSDSEFERLYNIPPWQFVNNVLQEAGLDFRINHPDPHHHSPFQPKLTKISNNAEVDFGALSSGEKVLMSFVFVLYYSQDSRQLVSLPKLLLLDEVDAPLHPSMCRVLVRAITESLVKQHSIHVILATHSASTVAIVPEEAIFIMNGNDDGLRKVTKGKALSVLTDGVPTLSINFDGRRQVFVESQTDARVYDNLYQIIKSRLASERSLEFVGVGRSPSAGSGCEQVKHFVSELAKTGNQSVFGIVDWDTKNRKNSRVFVVVEDERYGLENCIYDPLLIGALVMRTRVLVERVNFQKFGSYVDLGQLELKQLQEIVEAIETVVLGSTGTNKNKLVGQYVAGFSLMLSSEYLATPCHTLEDKILAAFPEFRVLNKHSGDLM